MRERKRERKRRRIEAIGQKHTAALASTALLWRGVINGLPARSSWPLLLLLLELEEAAEKRPLASAAPRGEEEGEPREGQK